MNPRIPRGFSPAKTLMVAFIAALSCLRGLPAEEKATFQKETSEILLIGQIDKWEQIELRRTSFSDGVVAYRWELHQSARDRRGQGSFTATTECFLNIHSKLSPELDTKGVEVLSETPERLELKFTFSGDGEGSSLHILATKTGGSVTVTFKGKGELYDEFIKKIETLKGKGDGSNGEFWSIRM